MARLVNTVTKESFSIHFHADNKKPSYFDEAKRSRKVTLDGKPAVFVMHPTRDTSNRVNFQIGEGKKLRNVAVDNAKFWDAVMAAKDNTLQFETAEGRATKAEAEKAAPAAA